MASISHKDNFEHDFSLLLCGRILFKLIILKYLVIISQLIVKYYKSFLIDIYACQQALLW